jgi:predicted unusual protein kinase regulating ubiquinone biosynthesis (AarF/ABC1/UbiB family)
MRTLRILFALGPPALSILRDRRRWLLRGGRVPRSSAFHGERAQRIVATIAGLGPTFVKLAQVFAARADLIPEPYISALGTLHDQVPAVPADAIEREIVAAYGEGTATLFERFDREPVAAASLGQVHRARWRGRDVAVKVLRPNVEALVEADLRAARRILGWIARYWDNVHVRGTRAVIDEFSDRVHEEMDFRLEAEHGAEIGRNFAANDRVHVPAVVHDLTRRRVLVMEFVEGTRIDRLDASTVDVDSLVATLVEIYVQMMLVDGLFHADPHPGNLMLGRDGRLVLLDFGMVVHVPEPTRRTLMRTVLAAIRRSAAGVAEGFLALGVLVDGTDTDTVLRLAELLIVNAFTKTTTQQRIDALLADKVMKTLYDFPVVLPRDLVYFARTAALIEGVGTRYDPFFQAIPIASPVVLRMRTRILRSLGEDAKPSVEEVATVAGYALGTAFRWWERTLSSVLATGTPNERSPMRQLPGTKTMSALALCFTVGSVALAQAAPGGLPTSAQQIAAAVLPLPADLREGATVMGFRAKDKLEVLREGKNGMTCLALFVIRDDFHVACYHKGLEPFMARGRELRAQGVKGDKVDSARFAEVRSGKLKMPAYGALYSLSGKKEAWDAKTGKVTGASPLGVVYIPGATTESTGLSANPSSSGPWIMFPGTPKAHIMIVGAMTP